MAKYEALKGHLGLARKGATGLSQVEFAEKLGVGPDVIRKWEGGHAAPRFNDLQKLFRVLGPYTAEILRGMGMDDQAIIGMGQYVSHPQSIAADSEHVDEGLVKKNNRGDGALECNSIHGWWI